MKKLLRLSRPKRLIPIGVILLLLLSSNVSLGQDCEKLTQEAEVLYEKGDFASVISSLKSCQYSADPNLKWKTHRLLAMAYLATEEMDSARNSARRMLKLNPRYKANKLKDPNELAKLLHSIPVIPKLSFGLALSIGTNTTMPSIKDVYSVIETTKKYEGKNSYQFGFSTNYRFNQNIALDVSIKALTKKYEIDYSTSSWGLKMEESLTYINLPVALRYIHQTKGKIKPYAQFGGYASYLVGANNSFEAKYNPSGESYSQINLNSIDRRNRMDYGLFAGLGASYRVGDGQFFLQANFFKSFQNIAKEDKRYENKQLLNSFFYVDDNVVLDNLAISIGYSLYINYKILKD